MCPDSEDPGLEIKRLSITRLKQSYNGALNPAASPSLEIKRLSITRLKLKMIDRRCGAVSATWNQKTLDYEIETSMTRLYEWLRRIVSTWNQKTLDYEIETQFGDTPFGAINIPINLEIKRLSITRLKQVSG